MHTPVLAGPALEFLRVRENGTYVDCTAGAGGHTALIAARLNEGTVIALDRDEGAVKLARARLKSFPMASVLHRNYGELAAVLAELGIDQVDGILIDAGMSSMQLDDADRGFSLQRQGPLDMRMDRSAGPTAADFLAAVDEVELVRILKEYGDLRKARAIARAIVKRREKEPLKTTQDLAKAVSDVFHFVQGVPEETRTVFQAIRIAVNDEFRWLEAGARQAISLLAPGGRFVGISFHSGEDRILKNVLREASRPRRILKPDGRIEKTIPPTVKLLTPKPVTPSTEEIQANPRAHSARLRAAERLGAVEDLSAARKAVA